MATTIPPEITFLDGVLTESRVYLTAVVAVYYWEWIVTFPKEYQRMWKAESWTLVRAVFFFNRYWGIGMATLFMVTFWSVIPSATCKKIHFVQPVWALLLIWSNDFLLGARVYAIWNKSKIVLYGLLTLSLAGGATKIYIFSQDKPLPIPDGFGLKGCISNGAVSYIWLHWAIPLFYDTTVFILTVIPLAHYWRTGGTTPLLQAFLRDGALFFAVAAVANLINVIYFVLPNVTNNAFNVPLAILVPAIMASRVVLNLRAPSVKMASSASNRGGLPSAFFRTTVVKTETKGVDSVQPTHIPQSSLSQTQGVMVNIEKTQNIDQESLEYYGSKQGWKPESHP